MQPFSNTLAAFCLDTLLILEGIPLIPQTHVYPGRKIIVVQSIINFGDADKPDVEGVQCAGYTIHSQL